MRDRTWSWLCLLWFVLLGGCTDGTGPDEAVIASVRITPAADTLTAVQDTLPLSAEARDSNGRVVPDARVVWTSLDPAVASVDSVGRVVARANGTARITATSGSVADTAWVTVLSEVESDQLSFVRLASSAPALVTRDTSFWAVRGADRRLEIHFLDGDDDEFLEFRVRSRSLQRYPDGRSFADGDSVLIRVQVDEGGRFLFRFEPSGLQFSPEEPAELRVRYLYAEEADLAREDDFFLWKQETPDSPWMRIATLRFKDRAEIRAEITGFTAFSLATL